MITFAELLGSSVGHAYHKYGTVVVIVPGIALELRPLTAHSNKMKIINDATNGKQQIEGFTCSAEAVERKEMGLTMPNQPQHLQKLYSTVKLR